MGTVAIKEVECLVFCIFWCQLLKILKARQKRNALEEKKVTAQIQNLFASMEERKTMLDFALGGLGSRQFRREVLLLAEQAGQRWGTGWQGCKASLPGSPLPDPHLWAALHPDHTMHLLSLPLLQSNVIRKICFS